MKPRDSSDRPRGTQGFTLIEVLMYLVVASVVLGGIVQLMATPSSTKSGTPVRQYEAPPRC
jgi:prepilin-type N-terminal cleavage/methylation domain-containing protein